MKTIIKILQLFLLVHKQNKGIKMIDAVVKLDQY